jgi:hypothetical protein
MSSVYEWQIYCETESAWITGYDKAAITACPTDTAHTVTAGSVQKLREYSNQQLKIIEFQPEPGQPNIVGYKQVFTVKLRNDDYGPDDLTLYGNTLNKMTWTSPPDPIYIYSIKSNTEIHQKGDIVNLWVNKDLGVGNTTTTTAAGSFSFIASTSPVNVATLMFTGFEIALYDGGPLEVLGRITAVNQATNEITCQYATTRELATGTGILVSIHTVNNLQLSNAGPVNFGEDTPSALGYVAPNTPVVIWYDNQHPRPTSWSVDLTVGYGTK